MRPLHWLYALLGAFSLHLAMAYGFTLHNDKPVDSSIGAEELGVQIQLGTQGASLLPAPVATPEVIEAPVPEPPPELPPELPPEPKPVEKAVEVTKPKPPEPEVEPVVVSMTKTDPSPDAVLVQVEQQSADTSAAMFSPPKPTDSADTRTVASVSQKLDNSSESGSPGSQSVQQTAAYAKARNSYFARLMGTLARNKRYPKEAKKKKEQGTVLLQFSINKRGEVVAASIVESSGFQLLDDAALQMLSKASPLPSIPDDVEQQRLEITIPVEYSLITK